MLKTKSLTVIAIGVAFLGLFVISYTGSGFDFDAFDNPEDGLSSERLSDSEIPLNEDESILRDLPFHEKNPETMFSHSFNKSVCLGIEGCIHGVVTRIVDGDTIRVNGDSGRFALASAPEIGEDGGNASKKFIEVLCPVGSEVIVDQDDLQTIDKHDRILAVIHCNGHNLNEELVESQYGFVSTQFCDSSEFANQKWAQDNGCPTSTGFPKATSEQSTGLPGSAKDCDPSYPDFCILPPPPDLDCSDVSEKKFTVLQPDPHGFDGDRDGLGCES